MRHLSHTTHYIAGMPRSTALRTTLATTAAAVALSLAPAAPTASAAPAPALPGAATATSMATSMAPVRAKARHDRGWAELTTYRRAILEGCRPPRDGAFRRLVLRLRNAHDKRLRRAEVTFKDRAYSLPWSGDSRTPWVRAGRAAPLAHVSTTGRLVTQRFRVRLRTRHDVSPARSLRWSDVPTCRRGRRH